MQTLSIFTLLFSFPNNGANWIFSLKNLPITVYRIYLASKIFSFNLPAKQRVKTQLEFECVNGYFKNFLTRVYFPCSFAFSNHWQSLSQYLRTFFVCISIYFGIKRTSRLISKGKFKLLYLSFVSFSKKDSIIKIDQYQVIFRLTYNDHYFPVYTDDVIVKILSFNIFSTLEFLNIS